MIKLSVKTIPEATIRKFIFASRLVSLFPLVYALLVFALMQIMSYLELRWEWLLSQRWILENIIFRSVYPLFLLTFTAQFIIPGLLFIILYPELGRVWQQSFRFLWFSYVPWEQLSKVDKILSFLSAMFSFAVGIFLVNILYKELIISGSFW